jgi:hypothetical protein
MLVIIAVCSLTLSVATRFSTPSSDQSHIVKSVDRRSAEPQRQHLDKDATRWVAAVASFIIDEPIAIEPSLVPASPLLPQHTFSESLYNRPPPSPEFYI